MIKIGLDISQNSTGICINWGNQIELISFLNASKLTKFQKELTSFIDIQLYDKTSLGDIHSNNQIINLLDYINLSEMIVNYISNKLKNYSQNDIIFSFEDYSMGSSFNKNNYLIQLVTLTTLIRSDLIKKFNESKFIFTPPTRIKKEISCLVYGMNEKGECRNENNISGGKFTKHDMITAFIKYNKYNRIIEEDKIYYDFKNWLLSNQDDILKVKKISSPLPDVIDAFWIQEFLI